MKLLFKYATRARFKWFKQTLETYYSLLSLKYPFEFRITLDEDDSSMNCEEARVFMEEYRFLSYRYGHHKTKIEAINADMDDLNWDILVVVSDDMIPQIPGFDVVIVDAMQEHFPDTDGALHFNDGLYGEDRTITLSIMGRELYRDLGYIYHPDYKSFYCDNEFTDVVRAKEKVVYIPQVIIKHDWRGDGADDLYRRNSRMGKPDKDTYERRKAAGFPNVLTAK